MRMAAGGLRHEGGARPHCLRQEHLQDHRGQCSPTSGAGQRGSGGAVQRDGGDWSRHSTASVGHGMVSAQPGSCTASLGGIACPASSEVDSRPTIPLPSAQGGTLQPSQRSDSRMQHELRGAVQQAPLHLTLGPCACAWWCCVQAMRLVAAAKVRRAQQAVINARPFSENLVKVRTRCRRHAHTLSPASPLAPHRHNTAARLCACRCCTA